MGIKVKRIHILNFKPFENYLIKFDSENLIVFDGPNGFGKTSFYDAIELLFTGNLRRYKDLADNVIDQRHTIKGSPLLNDRGDGDLVIKAELDINGEIVCVARIGNRQDLLEAADIRDPQLRLYTVTDFENTEYELVNNEHDFLTKHLGDNYAGNFEHLNYIEQEENIYLLKSKDKDRKEAIAHLFNTSNFDERIKRLTDASKNIGKFCGKEVKDKLLKQKQELDEYRNTVTGEYAQISYTNLISWKKMAWDAENLQIPEEQYVNWLRKGGEFDELKFFVSNISEFKKDRKNKLVNSLLTNENLLTQLINYWEFIEKTDEFDNKLKLKTSIDELLGAYRQGVLDSIVGNKININSKITDIIKSEVDVVEYSEQISVVLDLKSNTNKLSQLLVDVKDSRITFINKFLKYETEIGEESSCPLCGYSWQDAEELKLNFDSQAKQLEELIKSSDNELNEKLTNFVNSFVEPIIKTLERYQSNNTIDVLFVNSLREAANNYSRLNDLNKLFVFLDVDISTFFNKKPSHEHEFNLSQLKALVDSKKYEVNKDDIHSYYERIFLEVFDEDFDNVSKVNKDSIDLKRKYVEWQHSLYRTEFIKNLEIKYQANIKKQDDYIILKKKLDSIKKIYSGSLKSYQNKIIQSIEILFHIYSGRIAQEGKGSLGLFIESDKNGIRFLENHSKQHDAVFSMSSGQLATLVISFTLALNKRYSDNKFLFIDDPIQTLDELNVAGLVDLLRNEFSDRQIFISTHEDTMSTYMRYKFKKYGLGAQRLSFKESQLSFNDM